MAFLDFEHEDYKRQLKIQTIVVLGSLLLIVALVAATCCMWLFDFGHIVLRMAMSVVSALFVYAACLLVWLEYDAG